MTVEKALKRFLEDFDMSSYVYYHITDKGNGSKCKLGGMVESENLSMEETESGLEFMLRVKSAVGGWVREINLYNRVGSFNNYNRLSVIEDKNNEALIIVTI